MNDLENEATTQADDALDEAQRTASGDMPPTELRAALHAAADAVADYLEGVEDYAVLPPLEPGELRARLDGPPPEEPEPLERIMRDVAAEVRRHFKDKVFEAVIPRNVRLAEAPSHGLPILQYDIKSRGAQAYLSLASEFLKRRSEA